MNGQAPSVSEDRPLTPRNRILREGLDLGRQVGVEIGPLCWPAVDKSEGEVIYVDYADRQTLVAKYEPDPNVDTARIVDIDAIWGGQTLDEALGGRRVDYVIASHVAEHVPDLITWLEEVASVLTAEGQLRLVLPDKRFSFDYLRSETDVSDLVAAYAVRARRPQIREVVDFKLYAAPWIDNLKVYSGEFGRDDVQPIHTIDQVLGAARALIENPGDYVDVHCWVFQPRTFAGLMEQLARYGLLNLACCGFVDSSLEGGFEFFVFLKPSADRAEIVESWRRMAHSAADPVPGSGAAASLEAARRESDELTALRARVAALETSTSWRMTAPLRWLVERMR